MIISPVLAFEAEKNSFRRLGHLWPRKWLTWGPYGTTPGGGFFSSVQPANLLIGFDLEAIGHPRRFTIVRQVASRARHPGCATAAGARSCQRPAGVLLTDPAYIVAEGAFDHAKQFAPALVTLTNFPDS